MNDYQSSKLVDILPPPAMPAADHSSWSLPGVIIFLGLLMAAVIIKRSRAFAKFQLRRQIIRRKIDSRQAAAEITRLVSPTETNLQRRLLELRFGPAPAHGTELLDILRRLP
jgi:hypothetical protein